jgi:hypothetical protein
MNPMNEEIIRAVAELGPTVQEIATIDLALREAKNEERAAEALLLETVIAAIKPALRALSHAIASESYYTTGQNGCNPVSRDANHAERGLLLQDNYWREKDTTGNRGTFGGRRLYLLSDGRLAETRREGTFSNWQGEASSWQSTLAILAPLDAVRRFDLNEALENLHAVILKRASDSNIVRDRDAAKARAAKLIAVVALIKK